MRRRGVALLALASVGLLPAVSAAKPAPGSDLGKLATALLELRAERAGAGRVEGLARSSGLRLASDGGVLVDVYVDGDPGAAASALRIEGMAVAATAEGPLAMVEGLLPVAALDDAAGLERVRAIVPVRPPGVDVGSVTSEGDAAHRGPAARALGPTGAGVIVGVISDSINRNGALAGSIADGDLPPDVQILNDDPGGSNEGLAMAEVVYDGAPGIPRFLFSSGTTSGPAGKAAAIDGLTAAGARIIVDDIFYLDEPFFQDGAVAQAVDRAHAAGVAYFASAGNRGRQSYEANFVNDGGFHNFGGGDNRQTVMAALPTNRAIRVMVQWDEPFGAVQTDLDAYLYRSGVPAPVAMDEALSIQNGLPTADLTWLNTGPAAQVELEIRRAAGTRSPFIKHIVFENDPGSSPSIEYATDSDTINPDAASARGALATAAVGWSQPGLNVPEPFSSRGPKTRLFDAAGNRLATPEVRQKPEVAGADVVSTGVAGFSPFSGTSAAAPSAAAVGALILSAQRTNTADDLYGILQQPSSSIDCLLDGRPDADCGFGFLLADAAVQRSLDVTPPTVTALAVPAEPNGRNGFYVRRDVTVTFAVSDDGSPVTAQTGCEPTAITTETGADGTTLTCTATSAGGTTTLPFTVKRDDSAPRIRRIRVRRRGTRIRFRLSEPGRVTVTVERRRRGRFRRLRRYRVAGRAGANRARRGRPRLAKEGRYRVKIRATDAAGNRSRVRRKRFRVGVRRY